MELRQIVAWTLIALMALTLAGILLFATRGARAVRRSRNRHERSRGARRAEASRLAGGARY